MHDAAKNAEIALAPDHVEGRKTYVPTSAQISMKRAPDKLLYAMLDNQDTLRASRTYSQKENNNTTFPGS